VGAPGIGSGRIHIKTIASGISVPCRCLQFASLSLIQVHRINTWSLGDIHLHSVSVNGSHPSVPLPISDMVASSGICIGCSLSCKARLSKSGRGSTLRIDWECLRPRGPPAPPLFAQSILPCDSHSNAVADPGATLPIQTPSHADALVTEQTECVKQKPQACSHLRGHSHRGARRLIDFRRTRSSIAHLFHIT